MKMGFSNISKSGKKTKHLLFLFLLLLICGKGTQASECSIDEVNKVIDEKFSGIKTGQIMYDKQLPNNDVVEVCLLIDYDKDNKEIFNEVK